MAIYLKNPLSSYPPRFAHFLEMVSRVRRLSPHDQHFWQVMDSVAFQDAETALETTLYNARRKQAG